MQGTCWQKTTVWFTQDAVEESTDQMYNRATNTIEVDKTKLKAETDLFAIFGDHATEADRLNAKMTGAVIPEYGFDSDPSSKDEDEPKPKTTFDLRLIFNLTRSLAGAGKMDDQNSIGTNATGVSNATQQILAETIGTRFECIDLDGSTVTSTLTEQTLNTPPQQPRNLNTNSENEHNSRRQEGQKEEEDEMDVESNGKKKDNKTENSPDHDAIMVGESSSNEHKGEDRQNNRKNDNIDDHSEGSEKGSNKKEGGGGRGMVWERGRGRFPLSIQDDKGGRGGNHSQETEGSNLDTSQKKHKHNGRTPK